MWRAVNQKVYQFHQELMVPFSQSWQLTVGKVNDKRDKNFPLSMQAQTFADASRHEGDYKFGKYQKWPLRYGLFFHLHKSLTPDWGVLYLK